MLRMLIYELLSETEHKNEAEYARFLDLEDNFDSMKSQSLDYPLLGRAEQDELKSLPQSSFIVEENPVKVREES